MKTFKTIQWEAEQRKIFGEEKWVAKLHLTDTKSLEVIAGEVAQRTSGQPSEVEGLILTYIHQIRLHVSTGHSVNIEGLGTFYPKMTTKLVLTPEEVSIKNCIKTITVGFRPDTKLRQRVREAVLKEYKDSNNVYRKEE